MNSKEVIYTFEEAAEIARQDPYRQGNLIHLTAPGDAVMTGDLHNNCLNFDKLLRFCQLEDQPRRHLIIHELIHGNTTGPQGHCTSYRLVFRAAQLMVKFPHQVHYLLGNHAMAQISGDEVLKNGQAMVRAFKAGLLAEFGSNVSIVTQVLTDFLLSLPIAVRTDNRIWMSHSLPSERHLDEFDESIFTKTINAQDIRCNPSLHAMIWDRCHSPQSIERLREMWDVDSFIVGHKPQPQGYSHPLPELIILASDHSHGCFLPFELQKTYSPDELEAGIRPIASIR